jgi:hypothetical protein
MDAHKLFKVLVMGALLSLGCDDRDDGDSETTSESGDGDSDPETGDGDPETGDGDPETGDGDPETGDGDPETGDGDPETGDGDPETGDGDAKECCPEECWVEPCECTGGVCCWLALPEHPGCEQQC